MTAEGDLLEQILDQTYPVWGEGLSRRAYEQWNVAQTRTRWGAAHLKRMALVENGRLLASAKRYHLTTRIDGRRVPTLGIGAVFTPPDLRGRGHASALVNALCDEAGRAGAEQALLFSEIGAEFYARLGFATVPLTLCDIEVERRGGAPAVLVRAADNRDTPHIVDMLSERLRGYRFGVEPDPDLLGFSVTKKRLLAALDDRGTRPVEYFVAEEGNRAVAFVLIQVTKRSGEPDWWSLESCGDRDPQGARIGAILQVLLARTPGSHPPLIRSWWPTGLRPPQLRLFCQRSTAVMMMMRPIGSGAAIEPPLEAHDVCYWHADAF